MEEIILAAIIAGIFVFIVIGPQYLLVKTKKGLRAISEQLNNEQEQRQKAEKSLQDTQRQLSTTTEQLNRDA